MAEAPGPSPEETGMKSPQLITEVPQFETKATETEPGQASNEVIDEVPAFTDKTTDTGPSFETPSDDEAFMHRFRSENARAAVEAAAPDQPAPVLPPVRDLHGYYEGRPVDRSASRDSEVYRQEAASDQYARLNGIPTTAEKAQMRADAAAVQNVGPVRKLWNRLTKRS